MSARPFQPHRSRRSSSGRLIKLTEPADAMEVLAVNRPSKRAAVERSRRSVKRSWHSARVSAIRDLEARNAKLVSEVAELRSRSLVAPLDLSNCSTSELEELVKAGYRARQVLQSRGWITLWDPRDMTHAIWVDQIKLYPRKYPLRKRDLGVELPSYNPKVVSEKIKQLLFDQLGELPTDDARCPRLAFPKALPYQRPMLLHCVNSRPPRSIKRGSTVYMSEGKGGRIITAKVRSVKSASHSDAPYREYGDQWQSHMRNKKTALPKLVFE